MNKFYLKLSLIFILINGCTPDKQFENKSIRHLNPFPLSDVELLDGPFKKAMELDRAYLLSLDMDRLLADFRKTAKLDPKAEPYGGWESMGLNGHTLGHYLSACSMMYAESGDTSFFNRVSYIVSELSEAQDSLGTGYIGGIPPDFFEKSAFDPDGEVKNFRFGGIWYVSAGAFFAFTIRTYHRMQN